MLDLLFWLFAVVLIGFGSYLVGFGAARERGVTGGVGIFIFAVGVVLSGVTALW